MKFEVDTRLFDAMVDELAEYCKAPPEEILREEAGKIFSRAIELTPPADASKIREKSMTGVYSLQPATLYTPQRPQRRHLVRGRVAYKLSNRYPDMLWAKLSSARAVDVKKRLRARGLAKQSWWKIGQLLGLTVEAPAYVLRAIAVTNKEYPGDERARTVRDDGQVGYEFENAQPTINAINGGEILQRAIDGRVAYFVANIANGVFKSLSAIAKKYPGVDVS